MLYMTLYLISKLINIIEDKVNDIQKGKTHIE